MSSDKKENNEFVNVLKDWLRYSKTHGLDRLVLSKNLPLRLIWTLSLLCSVSLCSFLIARIVSDFLRFEVKSRIREVYREEIPFPRVIICNSNPLITPEANSYVRDYFIKNFKINATKYADLFGHDFSPEQELNYLSYMTNDPDMNITLRKSFGYPFIVTCFYYSSPCKTEDIISYYDINLGNCYIINSNRYANGSERTPYTANLPDLGLRILMFTGWSDNDRLYESVSGKKGIIIRIEDAEYDGMVLSGQGISPGNHAQFVLSRVETKNMPYPYSKCIPADLVDNDASKYMKKMGLAYTRRTCVYVCEQINTIISFGCNNLRLPIIPDFPLCKNRTIFDRIVNVDVNMTSCNDWCPIECDSVTYETSVSYTDWPNKNVYYTMSKNKVVRELVGDRELSYDLFRSSFATAGIIYKSIKYTEINETPSMTFVDLVAAIGGMMGLFLGFSLMVLVEFVEIGIEFFFIFIRNKFKIGNKSNSIHVHSNY